MPDLFRAYGKAAMSAAGLEQCLVLVLALQRAHGESDSVFSREHNNLRKMTLGPLLQAAKNELEYRGDPTDVFNQILECRNWLVHKVPSDTLGFVIQKDGVNNLEHNLLEIANFFSAASDMLRENIVELSEHRGIPESLVVDLVTEAFNAKIESNKCS